MMLHRQLGANGPRLSALGLGTWSMGGSWRYGWGSVDDAISANTLSSALDHGINWLDTAPIYGHGHSEALVGNWLGGQDRQSVFIATKCGLPRDTRGRVRRCLQPDSIRQELEESLRRLKTDYIDLYQHHWPDPNTSIDDSWDCLLRLQREGKIRYAGVCNYDSRQLAKCRRHAAPQSLQSPFSLLKQESRSLLNETAQLGTAFLAYSPLCGGLLGERFEPKLLAVDDWRRKDTDFQALAQDPGLAARLNSLKMLAQSAQMSLPTLASAWVLAQGEQVFMISGARKPEQLAHSIRAAQQPLSIELNQAAAAVLSSDSEDSDSASATAGAS